LALFAVFDGHGGRLCSYNSIEVFPRHLRKRLRRLLATAAPEARINDLSEVLRDVYRSVDRRLEGNGHVYEGCTATTVLCWMVEGQRRLQCANVGDSSAIFVPAAAGGVPTLLTVDHKPTLDSERQRLQSEGVEINGTVFSLSLSLSLFCSLLSSLLFSC
jgi:serine/threonine protein phosphatase PrpC